MQPPCGPCAYTFAGERNVKNNEIVKIQRQQQAAANSPRVFVWKNLPKKGKKRTAYSPGAGTSIQLPGIYMKDTFDNQPWTNLRRGLLQKAVTTRDRCVAHMLFRSCRDVRRPRHLLNAKNTAIVQSHPDGTTKIKSRISETPKPGWYTRTKIK